MSITVLNTPVAEIVVDPAPTAGTSTQPVNSSVDSPSASKSSTTTTTNGGSKPEDRGRDPLRAPATNRIEERSVSPGTMPDGTHAQTSGERGQNYEPGKLSKLKGKLPFGKR